MEEVSTRVPPARARVWNDHTKDYVEVFNEVTVRVPANSFIEMAWSEAVMFKGTYIPIQRDGMGNDLNPKKLRLEKIDATQAYAIPKFRCESDGKEFQSQEALDAHIAENHVEDMVDDDARKKFKQKK